MTLFCWNMHNFDHLVYLTMWTLSEYFHFYSTVVCFGRPRKKFHWFPKSEEQKQKLKKKKKILSFFQSFFTWHFSFSSFFFQFFQIFILLFSILLNISHFYLFSLPRFSQLVPKNFPMESLGGGALCPLPPHLLPHCQWTWINILYVVTWVGDTSKFLS